MDFSDKVKYVRMKLELSQSALAKELGVNYATISRWENNDRVPQMATLGKFYNFCNTKGIHFDDTKENHKAVFWEGAKVE